MIVLNPIFRDDMILQAQKPACIFGYGTGEIKITIGDITLETEASEGKFLLRLPVHEYGEVLDIALTDADSEVVLHRVTFGDVYLFAGQSNMAFKLNMATSDGDIYACDEIRIFSTETIPHRDRFAPEDGWVRINGDTAPDISALAYFTARELHKKRQRPIGLITAYQGASIIESWLSPKAIKELNIKLPDSDRFPDYYMSEYAAWNGDSILYHLNILPILPYTLKQVIWYQGESSCGEGESKLYDRVLTKLVTSWREEFQDAQLPFVIVQIADFEGRDFPAWHEIQKRQALVCDTLEGCQLAVSRDLSETDDIHPPTKHLLAARIAELISF